MDKPKEDKPHLPRWLAICFGVIGLLESEPLSPKKDAIGAKAEPAQQQKPEKPAKPPTDWKKITLVKNFNLIKKIGKGGFSEIWLAEDKSTKERVALKVVQLANADLEPEEVTTLIAEAKFLRTLDCPYLVKCRETAHNSDWLLLVLEYVGGGEMLDHIHKVKKYTEAEAAKLFAQVVSGISYLHNLNVVHRDIKPENIMFAAPVEECEAQGRPLRVKVIDLGMAMVYDPNKEFVGCVGTPGFVAPEIWNDKAHTFAMDMYALGVVLFIMLTGRKPHSGADIRKMTYCNKSINEAPGLKDERFLALSSDARDLLLKLLADDPRDRPTCLAVLKHPFITTVDGNAEAHREMGEEVRRRMRDLAKIRKLHGLCYAMHAHRPAGASQQAFLQMLEERRVKLKGESHHGHDGGPFARPSNNGGGSQFARNSLCGSYDDLPAQTGGRASRRPSNDGAAAAAGGAGQFGRISNSGVARGGGGGPGGAGVDTLALLSALPEMQHSSTMPPVRGGQWAPPLSPVPSCDPSMYGALEDAKLPRGWSAHPGMYEALVHKEALLEGLAPGAAAEAAAAVPAVAPPAGASLSPAAEGQQGPQQQQPQQQLQEQEDHR